MPRPKTNFKPIRAYVPVNLPDIDIVGLPASNPMLNPDRIRAIFHLLYLFRGKNVTNDRYNKTESFRDGWVNINSRLLMQVATHSYAKYIQWMEDSGYLEVRRDAVTGQKKWGRNTFTVQYRLPQHLIHGKGIRHFKKETITDHCALKAIYNLRDRCRLIETHKPFTPLPIHETMFDMMKEFSFDQQKAEEYLTKVQNGEISIEPTESGAERDYRAIFLNLDAYNEGHNVAFTCDLFGERFHSPITNLWKPVRSFLVWSKHPDEKLVTLDITNSQPFFASIAVAPNLIKEVIPEFIPCLSLIEPFAAATDFTEFSQLCANGRLYEFWAHKRGITRTEAKKEIFYIMFSKNKVIRNAEGMQAVTRAFRECFPSVSASFSAVKNMTEQQLPFIKDVFLNRFSQFAGKSSYHANLSCMMQRMESRIIRMAAQVMLDEGIIPFTTVHDSFILPQKYAPRAKAIMEEIFKQLGVNPPLIKEEIL